jgi:hypothetical protein
MVSLLLFTSTILFNRKRHIHLFNLFSFFHKSPKPTLLLFKKTPEDAILPNVSLKIARTVVLIIL